MAAEWITPTDMGIPLPLLPPEYALPRGRTQLADDNHAFHPASSPSLSGVSGEALRYSRVQRTDWYDHHIVYHGFYEGPAIVETEPERFEAVVMAAAGYIPEEAIDCHGYEPEIVRMTPEVRQRLWDKDEVHVDRAGPVRKFLAQYVVEQYLSHIDESHIDEFLGTEDPERRCFLGQWLVAQATEVAAEPISPQYRTARRRGLIPPERSTRPENFLQGTLGNRYERNPVVRMLRERLAG